MCVLALLVGLFGMHGLATAEAGGCHAEGGMVSAQATVTSMSTASMTSRPSAEAVASRAMAAMGSSCLFLPTTTWPALALALVAIVGAVVARYAARRWGAAQLGRSPPRSGVSLLHWVCVSRT